MAVTLHVGSSDGSFADVVGIADAPVLARVVAAARWSPVVLAASEAWCDEVGAPGASRVRCPGGTFWVRVPGASVVPGLAPSDIAPSSPAAPDRWGGPDRSGRDRSDRDRSGRDRSGRDRPGGRTVNLNVQGSVHGDQFAGDKVAGDKVTDGGVHHGSRSDDRRPR